MKQLALVVVLLTGFLAGCESQDHFSEGDITLQAKNAVDVLPVDPSMVAMMNVRELRSSDLGAMIEEELARDAFEELEDLIDQTGFDPMEDLGEIYVSVDEMHGEARPGFSGVAYASIDPDRLQAYIKERVGDEMRVRTYRGIDVFEAASGQHGTFSLVNEDMILFSNRSDYLEDMIDRLIDEETALSSNASLMERIGRASTGKSAWVVAEKPPVESPAHRYNNALQEQAGQIFLAVDYVVMAMNVESDGIENQVFLYPNADVSADDLESLTKGLRSALRGNPELNDEAMKMLDDIRVSSSRNYVRIQFTADQRMMDMIRG